MQVTGKQFQKARELSGATFREITSGAHLAWQTLMNLEEDKPVRVRRVSHARLVNFYESKGIVFTEDGDTTLVNTGS
jgi:hypothetical protein